MKKRTVSAILLALLLIGMLTFVFNIQPVRASGTIYIRPDGTVEGTDNIQRDGDVYTFTDNIYDRIVVEIDNIVVDGAGYTLQGPGNGNGTDLIHRSNVTIKNTEIKSFFSGIMLISSSNNTISGNNITNNECGIYLDYSSNNTISGNNITNNWIGIHLYGDCNTVYGNNIRNSEWGIYFYASSNNTISGNTITNSYMGIRLYESSTHTIYHNSFVDNTVQVYSYSSTDVWDDGYPSGGNYWSDHVTVDDYSGIDQDEPGSDGIVDEPYIIDGNDRDNYPLVEPWSPVISATIDIDPDTLHLISKGQWITCYIELPEGYDVSDIDVSTVMLEDTIPVFLLDVPAPHPVPTEIGDYDNDGVPDLMVKFDRAMVSEFILSKRITNGYVTLTITGEVDGTPFEGTDTIRVLMTGGGTRGHK